MTALPSIQGPCTAGFLRQTFARPTAAKLDKVWPSCGPTNHHPLPPRISHNLPPLGLDASRAAYAGLDQRFPLRSTRFLLQARGFAVPLAPGTLLCQAIGIGRLI